MIKSRAGKAGKYIKIEKRPRVHILDGIPRARIRRDNALNYPEERHLFSISEFSRACGVSRKTLCTRFKQETGETFASYVRRLRVERAKRLLDTTEFDVSQIAYQTGFSSQSHMQTVFKQATGLTPREWRLREIHEI